jgi:hypothetical protein
MQGESRRSSRDAQGRLDDDIPLAPPQRRRRRNWNEPLPFADPETASKLTKGRRYGPNQWMGHCPCHDDRVTSLSIKWGRKRNTVVKCHAGCTKKMVLAAIRALGYSLSPPSQQRATHRLDPLSVARALKITSRSERAIYEHLASLGDDPAPATYRALMIYAGNNERSVARAVRGLEYLGLIEVDRGRPFWSSPLDGGRLINPASVYTVAKDRLFRDLDSDDQTVFTELRNARKSEDDLKMFMVRQNNGTGTFASESYENAMGCAAPPTDGGCGTPGGGRRGVREALVRGFVERCAAAVAAGGGRWRGACSELLGLGRSWPRTPRTVLAALYMVRRDFAGLGLQYRIEWEGRLRFVVLTGAAVSPRLCGHYRCGKEGECVRPDACVLRRLAETMRS